MYFRVLSENINRTGPVFTRGLNHVIGIKCNILYRIFKHNTELEIGQLKDGHHYDCPVTSPYDM